MKEPRIVLSEAEYKELRSELLGAPDGAERAGFLYVRRRGETPEFQLIDTYYPPASALADATSGYLELRDGALDVIIRDAHVRDAAIVEMHSHPFDKSRRTQFSWIDRRGLMDVAPHITWRLPGRPYFALVFGRRAFDSLCWIEGCTAPPCSVELSIAGSVHSPTRLTIQNWRSHVEPL